MKHSGIKISVISMILIIVMSCFAFGDIDEVSKVTDDVDVQAEENTDLVGEVQANDSLAQTDGTDGTQLDAIAMNAIQGYNEGDYINYDDVVSGDWKLQKVKIYHEGKLHDMVRLKEYVGNSNEVKIPTAFYIDGKWVRTTVNMDLASKSVKDPNLSGNNMFVSNLFSDEKRKNITSVSFERPAGCSECSKFFVNRSMANMFAGFTSLKTVSGLGNVDTVLASNITSMFRYCENLESLNAEELNLTTVEDISHVFEGCKNLQSIDVSNWDVSAVTNMNAAFSGCESLKKINLSNWNPRAVKTMNATFYKCRSVEELDVHNWNIGSVTDLNRVFGECNSLTSLGGSAANQDEYLAKWNTENVKTMYQSFCGCRKLKQLNIADWNVENVTTLSHAFDMGLDNGSTVNAFKGFAGADGKITNKLNWKTDSLTNLKGTFSVCSGLDKLQFGPDWNTSNVTTMNSTFSYCSGLTDLEGMKDWNTSEVTDMHGMFYGAKVPLNASFKPGNNGIWDVSKVTDMGAMFGVSTFGFEVPLKSSVGEWNTSSLKNTEEMFYSCGYLGFDNPNMSFDLSNWNLANITNAKSMFKHCDNLKIINFGEKNFASNVEVNNMFDAKAQTNTMIISEDPTLSREFSNTGEKIANRIPYGPSYYVPNGFTESDKPVWKPDADCNYFDTMVVSPSKVMQGNEVKLTKNQLEQRYQAKETIESNGKKYTFEGWYLDPDYNNKVNDLTPYYFRQQCLYAKYTTDPIPPVTGITGIDRGIGVQIVLLIVMAVFTVLARLYARLKKNR